VEEKEENVNQEKENQIKGKKEKLVENIKRKLEKEKIKEEDVNPEKDIKNKFNILYMNIIFLYVVDSLILSSFLYAAYYSCCTKEKSIPLINDNYIKYDNDNDIIDDDVV
tara:strand:+ start:1128 stop:1457 length:330 start_codon:yes stop_codon:yes gene_type:complete